MYCVTLIISGSIAAYKSLELIRLLRNERIKVRVILTAGGAQFITPLSCAALSEEPVYTDLFSLTEESEMGHIRLAREAHLVAVAPASADFIAKAAHGLADDLASTILLAAKAPLLMAPAMNVEMWNHSATQANVKILKDRGVEFIGPDEGVLACGEMGLGKMIEPLDLCTFILEKLSLKQSLKNIRALVTAGPTQEPIDSVRYLSNASSGKQGYAIAQALVERGAKVILISGPTSVPFPKGVSTISVKTAEEMREATEAHLPVDVAICTAAVADWRPENSALQKIKKKMNISSLSLKPNPDILANLAAHKMRPRLLIGFAAETDNLIENARDKLFKCDWVVANDVSQGIFGCDDTQVSFVTREKVETWPSCSKKEVASKLIGYIEGVLK
ncbi:MAG: bifunctional phosphopantothenoylcysteine decarboxylase/phosphopantothenate--cysteine ligase CoaBC [Proteobacteria bacterium]|nr:bifunctional phosphopantothenoylcysteine decarboxylase/phosphopantothenate--cysteine ligase CoaBC [Pseudomonadota bacterium]